MALRHRGKSYSRIGAAEKVTASKMVSEKNNNNNGFKVRFGVQRRHWGPKDRDSDAVFFFLKMTP